MLLTEYLDAARDRTGVPSDNRLSVLLGVTQSTVSQYRRGYATPGPAVMVKLAELAGMDPAIALLHRAAWQADDQVSRDVVSRMIATWMERFNGNPLKMPQSLGAAAAVEPANSERIRYIMEKAARWITWGINVLFPPCPILDRTRLAPPGAISI